MNIHEEFKDLSDTTFGMLMNLKNLKLEYRNALETKGVWVNSPSEKRDYTETEKNRIVRLAKSKYEDNLKYFKTVWRARRRLQKLILNVN